MTNTLWYGDNLDILRKHVAAESVDLVYLDPPFNSNANYNVLFRSPTGGQSQAQIEAFEDTWHWNHRAEAAFDQVMQSGNTLGVPKDAGAAAALAEADKHQFELWALSMVEAQPYKGGKKGADRGIDGLIWFKPDGKATEKAIVSVKGGGVGDTQVKDLITTVEHENAKLGVFITLKSPTQPMKARAAQAGFYQTPYGEFPKIQILTIDELFKGMKPNLPWVDSSVFKKAKREETPQKKLDL